jgi:hypothetical protein
MPKASPRPSGRDRTRSVVLPGLVLRGQLLLPLGHRLEGMLGLLAGLVRAQPVPLGAPVTRLDGVVLETEEPRSSGQDGLLKRGVSSNEENTVKIDQRLHSVASERNLRQSTVYAYRGFLKCLGIVDDSLTKEELESRLLGIDNINSRSSAAMAVRAVPGIKFMCLLRDPSATTFLMMTNYQVRGPLMAHGGLRLGKTCAVTGNQLHGDRLTVDRQVSELHATPNRPRVLRLTPTRSRAGVVTYACPPGPEAHRGPQRTERAGQAC